jgi:transposase-like protein
MKTEETKFDAEELNLITLAQEYSDNDKARELLEKLRWPNGPVCPHCKNEGKEKKIYRLVAKERSKSPVRKGLLKCGACRKQFTVTVGTIYEDSHIPISTWLMAMFMMCSSKKAVSSHQIHRMLGVTYKTAWFMTHRIRYAMGPVHPVGKLAGTVEVDETFVGGKGDFATKRQRKTPMVALIQRDGACRTQVVADVTQKNLKAAISTHVSQDAVINTDDSGVYRGKLKAYKAHHVVNHSAKEYAIKMPDGASAHVNSCESFFSLLKRGVVWGMASCEPGTFTEVC